MAVEGSQMLLAEPKALPKVDTKILPRAVVISRIAEGGRGDLSESRRIFCEVICFS
jgi:hypothetical protein